MPPLSGAAEVTRRPRLVAVVTMAIAIGCRASSAPPSGGPPAASTASTAPTSADATGVADASTAAAGAGPELWLGRRVADGADAGAGAAAAITATASYGRVVHAVRDRRLTARATTMYSTANDNGAFGFRVELEELVPSTGASSEAIVGVGDAWWISDGLGASEGRSDTTFWLDRKSAVLLASAFGVPLHERTRLDEGVRATWELPRAASARTPKAPVTVKLHVVNDGHASLELDLGGFSSSSRDEHFTFTAKREGEPAALATTASGGYGTSGSDTRPLGPGARADFAVDLRQWITLDTPGTYVVTASFSAELRPVRRDRRATTTADAADVWDLTPSTTAKIVVGP